MFPIEDDLDDIEFCDDDEFVPRTDV